ncbi:MAG TPA: DUF2889 domain-containing protein [Acidimicrobiia bacterium]|nr:DUF2889 domain-containing protein [Acidimicrobiia bacterium]
MGWPGGTGGPLELVGRARDLLTRAGGEPVVLDEAAMHATVDDARTITAISADTHALRSVSATPRVLPFPECPWAAPNVRMLVGHHVRGFRTDVQQTLTELDCRTHLNDMLRCLSEVPVLALRLQALDPEGRR